MMLLIGAYYSYKNRALPIELQEHLSGHPALVILSWLVSRSIFSFVGMGMGMVPYRWTDDVRVEMVRLMKMGMARLMVIVRLKV